jgi:ferredoxin--NADP+ reductase
MLLKISNKYEIALGVYIIETPRVFSFIPGQVVGISLDEIPPRLYSIASGINEKIMRIIFDIKPEGALTNRLAILKPGDLINVSEPFGSFFCDTEPTYWIANGTGIAPFYSMLLSGLGTNKKLIHGGKQLNSFYFQKEIQTIMGGNYIRCCSRETSEYVYSGRLTQYLKEEKILPPDQNYYLCGSSEMVVETRDVLLSKGIPYNQILAEIYF